jgi:multidrug resistance efflux pump
MSLGIEGGGVVLEARDQRDFVEVSADFKVIWKGRTYDGLRLSRRHLVVRMLAGEGVGGDAVVRALREDEPAPVLVRIRLSGFVLELEMTATRRLVHGSAVASWRFDLTDIDRRNESALNQVVRTLLRGVYPTVEEFAWPSDPETALAAAVGGEARRSPLRTFAVAAAAGATILALLLYAGFAVFSDFRTVRTTLAAVTAPQIDLFSPATGIVQDAASPAGTKVARDQLLMSVSSTDIEAELQTRKVRLRYFEAMMNDGDAFTRETIVGEASASAQDVDLLPALKPSAARYARDLELGVIKSLETKKAALNVYSPCGCVVAWAVEPGVSVKAGDRLLTLVKDGPEDRRIEALVDVAGALEIRPGQKALVENPGSGLQSLATVERVVLDAGEPDRMGLPQGLRRDPRYAVVILDAGEPGRGIPIGSPLNVVIRK